MFFKTAILKNFVKFTGKKLCWSLLLIKLQAFRAATLLKRDSNTDVLHSTFLQSRFFYRTPPVAASASFKVGLSPFKNLLLFI